MRTNNLSKRRIKRIVNCFAAGLTAIDTSFKLKLHRNTINKYYRQIREAIAQHETDLIKSLHVDGQSPLFRLLWHKNQGLCVSTETGTEEDLLAFYLTVSDDKIYVLDSNAPQQYSEAAVHLHVRPDAANFAQLSNDSPTPVNNTDILTDAPPLVSRFFHYSKEKLTRFYGVKPQYTYLYLQELEFRFNNHDTNISNIIIKLLAEQEKNPATKKQGVEDADDAALSDM